MKKVRISKRHRPVIWRLEPLSADPRDHDIMRAKQFAGRSRPPGAALAPATRSLTGASGARRIVMPSASSSTPARPPSAVAKPLPCQRGGGDLWFSELSAELEQAKACCRVRGGEIFHQGAIIARKRPRGRPRAARRADRARCDPAGQPVVPGAAAPPRHANPGIPAGERSLRQQPGTARPPTPPGAGRAGATAAPAVAHPATGRKEQAS